VFLAGVAGSAEATPVKVITLREKSRRVAARKAALGDIPDERITSARN
jgi:hypothetical protein